MGGTEQHWVNEAFRTGWVVPLGPNVDEFERLLGDYIGAPGRVVALSAGTAAIHLGLVMLGVGAGDEVVCQSFTFSASANPVVYQGATPVFVGSEKDTWNMDRRRWTHVSPTASARPPQAQSHHSGASLRHAGKDERDSGSSPQMGYSRA